MKFSENWLREWVSVPTDRAVLSHALTMAGLEVEELTPLGEGLEDVVVAEIVSAERHPAADRLQICQVAVEKGVQLTIVCGAPNARAGLKVPLAKVGAKLPGGIAIKQAKLRGVASFGMLCSAKELGLEAEAAGLLELPGDAPVGQSIADYLGLPDAVFELKLTPNRPDCLGLYGLAHDVAALFGTEVRAAETSEIAVASQARREVQLRAGAAAPRYLGRVIEDIDPTATTPLWMAERLRRAGLRPISPVVDVTHYVMLELGQPMHAFDHERLDGAIVIRPAKEGETLKLLDGSEAELDPSFLLVADQTRALAVAGVMGGYASRVTETTRHVFLETAFFAPAAIMGRARKLGLHTDASHRFERGVDPELPRRAMERASELLLSIAGGRAGPITVAEQLAALPPPQPVVLRRARLARVLGIEVPDPTVSRIFAALGMQVQPTEDGWLIRAPSRRFDIEREEDLIEEVARIYGYQHIPTHRPAGALSLAIQPEGRIDELALREQLAARGYFEALNLAFLGEAGLAPWGLAQAGIALANPLSADLARMRPSLLPGLAQALKYNRARQQERIRLFELGRVFAAGDPPLETPMLAVIACGAAQAEQWGEPTRPLDYYDLKGELESLLAWGGERGLWSFDTQQLPEWLHPGQAARVLRAGVPAGYLGALHPRLLKALELNEEVFVLELALESLLARRLPQARPVPRYPAVRRDLALDLPLAVSWAQVRNAVFEALGESLVELRLFDRYQGAGVEVGRKSLAMGLILQDASRTLTDADADRCIAAALQALALACQARLRG